MLQSRHNQTFEENDGAEGSLQLKNWPRIKAFIYLLNVFIFGVEEDELLNGSLSSLPRAPPPFFCRYRAPLPISVEIVHQIARIGFKN